MNQYRIIFISFLIVISSSCTDYKSSSITNSSNTDSVAPYISTFLFLRKGMKRDIVEYFLKIKLSNIQNLQRLIRKQIKLSQ